MTTTEKSKYEAIISVLGKNYTAKGETILAAISRLEPRGQARTKSILTVKHGINSKDRVLTPFVVNRLFNLSPTVREVALKQVANMFDV